MDKFDNMLAKYQPVALSLFRFITGLLLFQYGVAKILKFPIIPDGNAYAFLSKVQLMSLSGAAGLIELIFGALLLIGLFTRFAAFILAGEMAFAYFIGHAPKGFFPLINGGTLAIMFCFACLYLSTAGGGPRSASMRCERSKFGHRTLRHSGMVRRTRPQGAIAPRGISRFSGAQLRT